MLAAGAFRSVLLPGLLEKVEALHGCKVSEMPVWMYYVVALQLCLKLRLSYYIFFYD